MNNKKIMQEYINNVRRYISRYLKPGIGLLCTVYPAHGKGAILVFTLNLNGPNKDIYMNEENTINDALKNISQRAFGGNLDGFKFGGTNLIMEDNRMIFIKGEDNLYDWNERSAKQDVNRIVNSNNRG